MEKPNKFESLLPVGYEEKDIFDRKNVNVQIICGLIGLVLLGCFLALGIFLHTQIYGPSKSKFMNTHPLLFIVLFIVALTVVMVLHELVHGLVYKIVAKNEKLKFGITGFMLYCTTPSIYLYRKQMIIASLLPFIVIGLSLFIPLFFISDSLVFVCLLMIFSIHFTISLEDLYFTGKLLFKYKEKDTLITNNGIKLTIYTRIK